LVAAAVAIVPLATAGAQAPDPAAEVVTAPEGSVPPPGGEVTCTTGATLDPTHGPPGTIVTVTATFQGNCDDISSVFFQNMECEGRLTDVPNTEAVPFPMTVDPNTGVATGEFTAPIVEPDPPVVDATEPVTVEVTCSIPNQQATSPGAEGGGSTVYSYPGSTFTIDLFADPDSEQPTYVEPDEAVAPGGVVAGSPSFTG
jgi:hypothetical protein